MARYQLLKPHYLGTRYFSEGSFVDYDGPPSKGGMIEVDDKNRPVKKDVAAADGKPVPHEASEVPVEGGEPPDPTWAPQARAAFSTKTLRKPDPNDPDKQATIVRVPASAPSASAPSGDPGESKVATTLKPADDKAKAAAFSQAKADERAAERDAAAHKADIKRNKE